MRKKEQKKVFAKRAQTAVEYMLLLTICALIVFASFNTFFQPGGRVRDGLDLYFNKVSNGMMGKAPVLSTGVTIPPCSSFTSQGPGVCNFYGSRCAWVRKYWGPGCPLVFNECVDLTTATCQTGPGCDCRCPTDACTCDMNQNRDQCLANASCVWYKEFYRTNGCSRDDKGPYCIDRAVLASGGGMGFSSSNCQIQKFTDAGSLIECCYNNTVCNASPPIPCLCQNWFDSRCDMGNYCCEGRNPGPY